MGEGERPLGAHREDLERVTSEDRIGKPDHPSGGDELDRRPRPQSAIGRGELGAFGADFVPLSEVLIAWRHAGGPVRLVLPVAGDLPRDRLERRQCAAAMGV